MYYSVSTIRNRAADDVWEDGMVKLTYKQCTQDDIHMLCIFSYRTFKDSFSTMNTPANLKAYLDKSFNIDKLRRELSNQDSLFFFLYADGELAGYLKLNEALAQSDVHDEQALEIERFYVAKEFQGQGMGRELMSKAIEVAKERNKTYVWLGVWEHNEKALRFYKNNGFAPVGTHSFFLGDEEQRDLILRKNL
jgi:ribosomal protein S18 acetylase RimI-like enzyme